MGYVTVKKQTESHLSLLREPSFLSKAVFVGFFVGVFGIFIFGSESLFFKFLIGVAAACLGCLIVDNYELCDFDKDKSEVRITRMHWFQHFINQYHLLPSQPYVTANLKDIKDVRVEEQGGVSGGIKAYQVVLSLDSGVQLGITEVFTTDDLSVHEKVAKLIRTFLGCLPPLRGDDEADDEQEEEEEDADANQLSSSDTDDDFEQISQADLEGIDEDIIEAASPPSPGHTGGAGDAGPRPEAEGEGHDLSEVKVAPVS